MEVCTLYVRLSCVRMVCAWWTCLRWEVGWVVACHAAVLNRQWHPMGAFSMGVRIDGGLSQRPVRVDCRLSYTTVQATIAPSSIVARLLLKLVHKVKCYCKSAKGSQFDETWCRSFSDYMPH